LLLKVLENETEETLNSTLRLFHERALPDLESNIKCGNSLIGPDVYDNQQMSLLGEEERYRINAFDWNKEFADIMRLGGFDAVIGNPPYIGFHGFKIEKEYFNNKYYSAKGKYDIYVLFIEKSLELMKKNGLFSFICPTNFMKRDYGKDVRKYLLEKSRIIEIIDFEHTKIFEGALNYTGIFIFSKPPLKSHSVSYRPGFEGSQILLPQEDLLDDVWIFKDPITDKIIRMIEENQKNKRLIDLTEKISEGIVTGANDVFLLSEHTINHNTYEKVVFKPCLRGKNIRKYYLDYTNKEYVFYPYNKKDELMDEAKIQKLCPNYYKHLRQNKDRLNSRGYFAKSSKAWYELWNQRIVSNFENPKIVVAELSDSNRFMIDFDDLYYGDTVCGFYLKQGAKINLKYVLGLLNSGLLEWFYQKTTVPKASGFFIYKTMFLKNIPIRTIDFDDAHEKLMHDEIVGLVDRIIELNKQFTKTKTSHEKTSIQRQIYAVDRQIDELVYDLYGLREKEIALVEGNENGG
jgi:hypothetical protein